MKSLKRTLTLIVALVAIGGASTAIVIELQPDRPAISQRPVLKKPAPPIVRTAVELAKFDEQDAQLQAALAEKSRWALLPSFLFNLDRDASGHVWFGVFTQGTPDDFKRSVERAAHGQTRIIRGGKILIVDSAGRYWCYAGAFAHQLLCYDGTKWLTPYDAPLDTAPPTTRRAIPVVPKPQVAPPKQQGHFLECALQDSAGNLYFVSRGFYTGSGLHKFSPDGKWTVIPIETNNHLAEWPMMTEQIGGRIAIFQSIHQFIGGAGQVQTDRKSGKKPQPRPNLPAVYIYDGHGMAMYQPVDRPEDEAWVYSEIALPDGSVLITCEDGSMSVVWPQVLSEQMQASAKKLIGELDDESAATRETAMTELLKLGPPIRSLLEQAAAAPADEISPQMQGALAQILSQLKGASQSDEDIKDVLFGGRYKLSELGRATRALDGKVRLIAMECHDEKTMTDLGPTMLTVDHDGKWSSTPISAEGSDYWLPNALRTAYEDMTGTLWTGDWKDRMLGPDFVRTPAAPIACAMGVLQGSDRDGRVYYQGDKTWMVFNREIPAIAPDMPVRTVESDGLIFVPGDDAAWGTGDVPFRILLDGSTKKATRDDSLISTGIWPLKNGAGIFWLVEPENLQYSRRYLSFYDGSAWHDSQAKDAQQFVHEHAGDLMRLAFNEFNNAGGAQSALQRLASDHGKGLWSQTYDTQWISTERGYNVQPSNFLEYFDGNAWHDAWALYQADVDATMADLLERTNGTLPPDQPKPIAADGHFVIGAVDDGHTVLIYTQKGQTVSSVSFENGSLQRKEVPLGDALCLNRPNRLPSANHRAWFWNQTKQTFKMAEFVDGQFVGTDCPGTPLMADSKDRQWFRDNQKLIVKQGTQTASLTIPEFDATARVVESHDGRLWLLDSVGLQELSAPATGDTLTLQMTGRLWKWNAPANYFVPYPDESSGLWLDCRGGQIARIELPAK